MGEQSSPQGLKACGQKKGYDLQGRRKRNQRRLMAQRRFADLEPLAAKILRFQTASKLLGIWFLRCDS